MNFRRQCGSPRVAAADSVCEAESPFAPWGTPPRPAQAEPALGDRGRHERNILYPKALVWVVVEYEYVDFCVAALVASLQGSFAI